MAALKAYVITAHVTRHVRHKSNSNQVTYGVAAPSRAAALRLFDAIGLPVTVGFFKDYGREWKDPSRANTKALLDKPGTVHWHPLDYNRDEWTPIEIAGDKS